MEIAAGEYIFTFDDCAGLFGGRCRRRPASRCLALRRDHRLPPDRRRCEAHHIDLSAHCAPALHRHVACAVPRLRHLDWFHDHVRIEQMLFDGAPVAHDGAIGPTSARPGHGLAFKPQDAERFRVNGAAS